MSTTEDLPPHVKADTERKDALVLELCERLGFDFVMESASRQSATRSAVAPAPAAATVEAEDHPKGADAIAAAIKDLEDLAATGKGMRVRVQASDALEQIQGFAKAAGTRKITGVRPSVAAQFAYDRSRTTLIVTGLEFPLATLNASHGRLYAQPHDETKTVHTLSLHDGAAGTSIQLGIA